MIYLLMQGDYGGMFSSSLMVPIAYTEDLEEAKLWVAAGCSMTPREYRKIEKYDTKAKPRGI